MTLQSDHGIWHTGYTVAMPGIESLFHSTRLQFELRALILNNILDVS